MKKLLLDTNSCSALFRGENEKLKGEIREAETIFISTIVMGEILTGFRIGSMEKRNRKILKDFLADPGIEVLDVTGETAEIYSQIKFSLRRKGKPIPTNDIWIAAQAVETGSVLISYDSHFSAITDVRLWGEQ